MAMEVPDFLPTSLLKERSQRPLGPAFELTAEEAILRQLEALKDNDHPYPDHGIEVMYRFAAFDPFTFSTYFGTVKDLGQFERFRRLFHDRVYRVLLGHTDSKILSSFHPSEHEFKQRVWIRGHRPGEEEVFEFTLSQRFGGVRDGYWLTESLKHDGKGLSKHIAY
ncbi:hypothetical protein KFL_000190570 [Klebsormidium nitens]|uniref:Uncharacterized protein n=1 Tax=Klebsormidium nitens TaxID=105231 RepID=A0A1Y1HJV9_KLENI|nr:hypothetical protein KFL_000190570 [Klebsormidium nitens]|eukprot:GAQ78840.1 hypothetical protein KFL_000190570 [Klebsormidium nitens]